MANRVQIRAGATVPTTSNLLYRELGYSTGSKQLYINDNGTIRSIGIGSILISASTNLNSLMTEGFYYCPANATVATLVNCPTTNAFSLLVERHAGYKQTLTEYMTSGAKTWTRNTYNAVWGSWSKVWTETTDGSGSGLDADLLDGNQASAFSLATHSHTWAEVTGQPAQATRWPTWTEVTGKPSLPVLSGNNTFRGNNEFYSSDSTGNYTASAIEVRETNLVASSQSAIAYSPTISFHWAGRVAKQLSLNSAGDFVIRNNNTIYGTIYHTGNIPTQATRWPTWSEVTSKPSTFAPSTHSHTVADLPNAYSLLWSGTISTAGATATLNSAYSNFDFLIVVIALDNASSENHVSVTIPVGTISSNARRFSGGLYMSSSSYMYLNFEFPSTTSIKVSNLGGAYTKAIKYVYGVKVV